MQSKNQKYLKGFGIAVLVLSILALLGTVISFVFMMVSQGVINANADEVFAQAYHSGATHGYDYEYSLSPSDTAKLFNILWGILYLALAWELVIGIATLVAGILAIRRWGERDKMGLVMGWGIGGAIAAFLAGRIVTTVLLVLVAVFANKVKSEPVYGDGQGFGADQAAYQAYGTIPQQPYGTAPQQPYGAAPQQPIPVNDAYAQAYGAEVGGPAPAGSAAPYGQPAASQAASSMDAASQAGAPQDPMARP